MSKIENYPEAIEEVRISPASQVNRTPLYFGADIDPLFGWCHTPLKGNQSRMGIVICPPLGHEYVHSHRSLRHLADHLAADGIPALRFDYQGTGDSAGVDEDPDRLFAWLGSIRSALNVLRTDYGCEQVGLIGLRMGGTLAATIASETDLACLVLWVPCVRGRHYVREMKALQLTGEPNSNNLSVSSAEIESAGFILTEHTIEALSKLDLEIVKPKPTRILLVTRDDLADEKSLREIWSGYGLQVDCQSQSDYMDMLASPHNTKVPVETLRNMVRWVREVAAAEKLQWNTRVKPGLVRNEAVIRPCLYTDGCNDTTDRSIRERIVQFGECQELFGILSEPIHEDRVARPIVLLLNAGAVHHIGTCRLYVLLARNLAQAGYRSLRMDFAGLGDSVIDDMGKENNSYTADIGAGILSALHALKQHHHAESFVLTGVCSGAYAAFHAGLELGDEPITECLLINPLTFYWKEGLSLDVTQADHFRNWKQYKKAVRQWDRWKRLFRGDVRIRAIFAAAAEKVMVQLSYKTRTLRRGLSKSVHESRRTDDLEADISHFLESGRRLAFVFSDGDPGHSLLMAHAGRMVKRLVKENGVSIDFIANANHTFTSRPARREVVGLITKHVVDRYGSGGGQSQR